MSILIKGMEMPKNCALCWMWSCCPVLSVDDWSDYVTIMENEVIGVNGVRDPNCPLVELPPHGRMIDADARKDYFCGMCNDIEAFCGACMVEIVLDNAPTIIEAEEEEDAE